MSLFSVKELFKRFPMSMSWTFRILGGPCECILFLQMDKKILQCCKVFLKRMIVPSTLNTFSLHASNLKIKGIHKFTCLTA